MTELEKVITGLECCSVKQSCSGCPWMGIDCNDRLHLAALELLKEQEAIPVDTKVIGFASGDIEVHCCRDCRTILDPAFHYCPNCGKAVKWE